MSFGRGLAEHVIHEPPDAGGPRTIRGTEKWSGQAMSISLVLAFTVTVALLCLAPGPGRPRRGVRPEVVHRELVGSRLQPLP